MILSLSILFFNSIHCFRITIIYTSTRKQFCFNPVWLGCTDTHLLWAKNYTTVNSGNQTYITHVCNHPKLLRYVQQIFSLLSISSYLIREMRATRQMNISGLLKTNCLMLYRSVSRQQEKSLIHQCSKALLGYVCIINPRACMCSEGYGVCVCVCVCLL